MAKVVYESAQSDAVPLHPTRPAELAFQGYINYSAASRSLDYFLELMRGRPTDLEPVSPSLSPSRFINASLSSRLAEMIFRNDPEAWSETTTCSFAGHHHLINYRSGETGAVCLIKFSTPDAGCPASLNSVALIYLRVHWHSIAPVRHFSQLRTR